MTARARVGAEISSTPVTSRYGARLSDVVFDGNLVESTSGGVVVWASGTNETNPLGAFAVMQTDGNFVMYDNLDNVLLSSKTSGNPGAYLTLGDLGQLSVDSASGVRGNADTRRSISHIWVGGNTQRTSRSERWMRFWAPPGFAPTSESTPVHRDAPAPARSSIRPPSPTRAPRRRT